jgi:anti-sigma B factor antagonist
MLLRIDTTSSQDSTVLAAAGEIDIDTVDLLRTAVADTLQAGTRNLVVDLNQVSYIDSAGLGVLVGTYKRVTGADGAFTVRCCEPRVLRLFAITGLTDLLDIDDTVPVALAVSEDLDPAVAV